MAFSVATWNVLATAYIRAERYPLAEPMLLDPVHRHPVVARSVARLQADIICLQEVETPMFAEAMRQLEPLGYAGELTLKRGQKPDGCATLFRRERFRLIQSSRIDYRDGVDGSPDSGHVAQVVTFDDAGLRLVVANSHVKWDAPDVPAHAQFGTRQIAQLLRALAPLAINGTARIICGDFNAPDGSARIGQLRDAGFHTTHTPSAGPTCVSSGTARMIDFVLHDDALIADPLPLAPIRDDTPLPSMGCPSDHVPVVARFKRMN